jgi:hypothetical protein
MNFLQNARVTLLAAGLALVAAGPALAVGVATAKMAMDGTTILPDPILNRTDMLPRSAATAGVARVSAMADGPLKNCSRRNPCALATPARDHVTVGAGLSAATGPSQEHVKYARASKGRRT